MAKLPISCFIISKNESDRVARTIRSVSSWVDEVIVVDSESTDDTVRVALSEGCRVITQPWLGFGPQKRYGEDQCRNDWVLNLDADEVITPALKEEILATFENGRPPHVAYAMPLELVYPERLEPRQWARDHLYVRLYDRRVVRFRNSPVHDTVVTGGHAVGIFRSPAYHYSFRSYDDLRRKLSSRMLLSAKHARTSSRTKLLMRLVFELPVNFFKYYLVRRHFTGGLDGMRYSWIQAIYRYMKIVHIWQRRRVGGESWAPSASAGNMVSSKSPVVAYDGSMPTLPDFAVYSAPSAHEIYRDRA